MIHSDNDFATVAYLRVKDAVLEAKEASVTKCPSIPVVLEEDLEPIQATVDQSLVSVASPASAPPYAPEDTVLFGACSIRTTGQWVAVTNIQAEIYRHDKPDHRSIEDKVHECFSSLRGAYSPRTIMTCPISHLAIARLSEHALDISHCANINIYISDMSLFARVNAVYATYFGSSPPARACVAVDMPPHVEVQMDCIAFSEEKPTERQALHVQGLSYWAPTNIGPYSQAITVRPYPRKLAPRHASPSLLPAIRYATSGCSSLAR